MKNLLGHTTKFVNLFKFSSFSSSHYSSISRFNHFTTITTSLKSDSVIRTILKLKTPKTFIFQQPLNVTGNYIRNFRYSGIGSILGVSVATASTIAYAIDVAEDALVDDRHNDSQDLSEAEENVQDLLKLVGKFWWPLFFIVTVLTNLDNPFTILFIKVTLFLLCTKPNPFSVYFIVDQLCQQSICEDTEFLNRKSIYASKVEVQDYKLLCLADIEVRGDKFTLVGIFCTWWTLPSWEACSLIGRSILLKITEQGRSMLN
ncbi:uncharacterized protein LOC123906620 isoform X1 [Trifolium pratense]|uniref:uncharacterized protein LOC123906620 isoform X1 n=1 Tax=Trifolium pratense TaxID=57577 RepID=UPI001E6944CB|nr:uncharacterized protein LOC123906620 isoform X1 [Trifolium pratense]